MKTVRRDIVKFILTSSLYPCIFVHAAAVASEASPIHHYFSREMVLDYMIRLGEKGYDPTNIEAVKKALSDPSYSTRNYAIRLLAARQGKEALPILTKALDDPSQMVRCSAATLLAVFGDKRGLNRMQKDLADFTPKKSVVDIDQSTDMDDRQKLEAKRQRRLQLKDAIAAAKVLAEFGDHRGYDLAVQVIKSDESAIRKAEAVEILSLISNSNLEVLRAENHDPDAVLLALAQTAYEGVVVTTLIRSALIHRRPEVGMTILETLSRAPQVAEDQRKDAERSLEYLKQKIHKVGQDKTKN